MRNTILFPALLLSAAASFGQVVPVILPNQSAFTTYVGDPFSQSFTCSNCGTGPVTWRIDSGSLPAGIVLDGTAGVMSGTATVATNLGFTLSALAGGKVLTQRQYGIVALAHTLIWSTPPTLAPATAATAVSRTLQVNKTSFFTLGSSNLPAGVSVSTPANGGTTATLAGTFPAVTSPTTYTFQLTAALPPLLAALALGPTETNPRVFSITVYPAPLLTAKFPAGEVGVAYKTSIAVSGGVPPFTFAAFARLGAMPPGLSLDPASGVISGTPTTAGNFNFTVAAGDANNAGTAAQTSISIVAAPSISTTALPYGQAGVAYSASVAVAGGTPPFAWSLAQGSLPTGLNLIASSGAIVGTPTTAGTNPFTVRVADANGAVATAPLGITVVPAALTIAGAPSAAATVGIAYTGNFTASGGNPPYTWSVATGQLPAGMSLSSAGVLSGTPAASAGGLSFPVTIQVTDRLFPLPGGSDGGFIPASTATSRFTLNVAVPPLTVTTTTLPDAKAGTPYTAALAATGGVPPYAWTSSGQLPPGLSMGSDGAMSGTPTGVSRIYGFQVQVTDSQRGTASASLTIQVNTSGVSIVTASLPNGGVGSPYSVTLQATGGTPPYRWGVSGVLPDGVTLQDSGTLQGTPTSAGTANFALQVTDAGGQTASKSFSIAITQLRLTGSLSDGVVGEAYSGTLTASGGVAPYSFAVTSGALPGGLSLDAGSGAVTGKPAAAGAFSFTITATDSQRVSVNQAFNVRVTILTLDGTLPVAVAGAAYSGTVAASGGAPPYAYAVTSGALPTGLRLDPAAGTITGTLQSTGSGAFTITATDAQKQTASKSFTISTKPGLVLPGSLPDGVVGQAYSAATVSGGTAPYSVTIAGDWPDGLTIGAAGDVTGKPSQPGTFRFTLRASDSSQPSLTAAQDYSITIAVPPLPGVTISRLSGTATAGTQPSFGVTLDQNYPLDLNGTAKISFQPLAGPGDPDVRFANGQTTMTFTIAAGQTEAVSAVVGPMAFSAGTTAGTITITGTLSSGGQVIPPDPAFTKTVDVPAAPPVISSVRMVLTPSGINVLVTGFSNTREVSGATLGFTADSSTSFPTSQFDVPVDAFRSWYISTDSAGFGGQFLLTVPFTFTQGSAALLKSVNVSLTNSAGRTTASGGF
jgi:hypothetical protein